MDTVDCTSDDLFGHLLDYQKTDDFAHEQAVQSALEHAQKRPAQRRASHKYRTEHPEHIKSRAKVAVHKSTLFEQQQGLCAYCGLTLGGDYEIDHIKPLIKGGTDDIENLCVCCLTCSRKKGSKLLKK